MAFYLGRGVAFWKPSSEGVKVLKHPPDPLAYFPSEPEPGVGDQSAKPSTAQGDEAGWDEINGLAAHLSQTCERIEELAERTEGMLRRVEELAANTSSQIEHTGLLPTAVQIAHVRQQLADAVQPRRRHHRHGWRGRLHSTSRHVTTELRALWLVARVKIGRHVSVPVRRLNAEVRKRFVLARVAFAARTDQLLDAFTPSGQPTGVRLVIQPLRAPKLHLPSIASLAGAVAFCSAIVMMLVAISATTPALGLPKVAPPLLTFGAPAPTLASALLASPGLIPVSAPAGAVQDPQPRPVSKVAQRQPYVGTLVVESDPVGATVYVNHERVGETPLKLADVRAGSRVIWVESEGYERWSNSVAVQSDKLTRINVKLTKESRK